MGRKNVFLTLQLGQESCIGFGTATGVSRGSYSKVVIFYSSVRLVGKRDEIYAKITCEPMR
jgi:hypothetical protein